MRISCVFDNLFEPCRHLCKSSFVSLLVWSIQGFVKIITTRKDVRKQVSLHIVLVGVLVTFSNSLESAILQRLFLHEKHWRRFANVHRVGPSNKFNIVRLFDVQETAAQLEEDWTSMAWLEELPGISLSSRNRAWQYRLALQSCIWTNLKTHGTVSFR